MNRIIILVVWTVNDDAMILMHTVFQEIYLFIFINNSVEY